MIAFLLISSTLASQKFVALPITRELVNTTSVKQVGKPDVPEVLQNTVYQYLVSFTLGSPGQTQTASIDTGSSDLWVFGPNTNAPTTFDPSQSTTNEYVNNGFSIAYVDGTTSSGNYYLDIIDWGGTNANLQFAVSTQQYQSTNGVFGIATKNAEASSDGVYDNFPYALKDQGIIDSVAYSLYLNGVNDNDGTLLFGAVDTSKYSGTLKQIPITSETGFNVDFEVFGYSLNGVLDAGTSLTYLPDDVVKSIAYKLNAEWDDNAQAYRATNIDENLGLKYTFGGVDVVVPASELFYELDGNGVNYLTILPYSQASNYILLGDSFLRSAYVVYDLSNNQIAIAQANLEPSEPNYLVISSSIPNAV